MRKIGDFDQFQGDLEPDATCADSLAAPEKRAKSRAYLDFAYLPVRTSRDKHHLHASKVSARLAQLRKGTS